MNERTEPKQNIFVSCGKAKLTMVLFRILPLLAFTMITRLQKVTSAVQ